MQIYSISDRLFMLDFNTSLKKFMRRFSEHMLILIHPKPFNYNVFIIWSYEDFS